MSSRGISSQSVEFLLVTPYAQSPDIDGVAMHKMLVTLTVKPGMLEAVLAAGVPFVEATRREPGCVSFDVYKPTDGRDTYVAIECFRDEKAYAEHGTMVHTKEFLPFLLANVETVTMEMVTPAG
jgi:quinol monooxygenase YgiN